jgi:hypothetical protein
MKTDALTKSKQMLEMLYFEEENKKHKISEFLNTTPNIEADYIMPFKSELIQNVLNKEGKGGVEIVVKYYISELKGANVIFNSSESKAVLASHNYIGINSTEYQSPYPVLELDIPEFDKYVIVSYYIFNCHFYDIQDTCTTYNISFFELCKDVHFPWDMISTNISIEFLETERLRQKPHANNSLNIEDPFLENGVSEDSMKEKKTKSKDLYEIFDNYGLFNIKKTAPLTQQNRDKFIELLLSKALPYKVAMIDYLGFFEFLFREQFNSRHSMYSEISKWFNSDKGGRNIRGNHSVLSKSSTEDKQRYTAHLHKETVKKDYQMLL